MLLVSLKKRNLRKAGRGSLCNA